MLQRCTALRRLRLHEPAWGVHVPAAEVAAALRALAALPHLEAVHMSMMRNPYWLAFAERGDEAALRAALAALRAAKPRLELELPMAALDRLLLLHSCTIS